MRRKLIFAVDFDGVIVANDYPRIGDAMPGAKATMNALRVAGHGIIIWTCRTGDGLVEAVTWLDSHRIQYDAINRDVPINDIFVPGTKVYANVYLDDKSFPPFPGWDAVADKYLTQEG